MKDIVDYLKNNPTIIFSSLAFVVSVVSLIVSIINSLRQRKNLRCRFGDIVPIVYMYANKQDRSQVLNPFGVRYSHVAHFLLVNPSSVPISYFDLELTDKNKNHYAFPVQRWTEQSDCLCVSFTMANDKHSRTFMPPPDLYSTIPPNCCLEVMIAIPASCEGELRVSFKTTKRTLCKSKKHSLPERFKTFSHVYKLT